MIYVTFCPKCYKKTEEWSDGMFLLFAMICDKHAQLLGKPVADWLIPESHKDEVFDLRVQALEQKGCVVSHESDAGMFYMPKFGTVSEIVYPDKERDFCFQFCIERHLNVAQQ